MSGDVRKDLLISEIIDNVPHYIFWKNKRLQFEGCNKRFYKEFGFSSADELIGKMDKDLFDLDEQSDKYNRDDLMVIQTGKSLLGYEETQEQMDGTKKTLLVSKVPLHSSEGEICGVLGIYTDITKQKNQEWKLQRALDQVKKLNHAKSEFIANMSHDLRTPLSGIMGLSEILEKEASEKKTKRYLEDIYKASKDLMGITDEILEVSSSDLGVTHYQQKHFSLRDILDQIISVTKPSIDVKQLYFNVEIDDSIPAQFYGFDTLVHRVILNLVNNAVKFTIEGGVTVKVFFEKKDCKHGYLYISVADTGIGIPKGKEEEIFEPFRRLSPSYEGVYSGVGLGLYLVKTFLKRIHGEITVDTSSKVGTAFYCKVPVEKGNGQITKEEDALELLDIDNKSNETKSVLLVEDNQMAIKIARNNIERFNCTVDIASSASEAYELSMQNKYDLIFMDIGLPDQNGVYTTKQIRQFSVQNASTPIYALTAHATEENTEECLSAGMQQVFSKPLNEVIMKEVLSKI